MGGGIKRGLDAPKGPARDIIAELGGGGAPGLREAIEFCSLTHLVEFDVINVGRPRRSEAVELTAGAPPALVAGGRAIGTVPGDHGEALNGCLAIGFALSGTVESFDADSGTGRAKLAGVQQQAA